jgi:hypothetical protein
MVLALGMLCGAWLVGSAPEIPEPVPGAAPSTAPVQTPTPSAPAPDGEPIDAVDISVALDVQPGATCIEKERLATQVRAWLEVPQIDARLRIALVGDDEHPLKLSFTLRRGEEIIAVREFNPAPERCTDMHAVVGLAIALAIDATVLESVGVEPRPLPPPPKKVDRVIPPPRLGPTAPRARPRVWRMRTEITGLFTYGHPPGVGGGAKLELDFGWREILDLGVGAVAASSGSQPVGDGAATFSVVGAIGRICAGPPWRVWRPRGCVGVIAGAAIAAGQGFMVDQTSRVAWVVVPFGADVRVRMARRVAFTLGVDGVAAVVQPVFEAVTIGQQTVVRRFPRVGLMLEAGLSILVW